MMSSLFILASILIGTNSVSFTTTATGIDKGTPVEFFIAGKGSDRDYETIFLLEDSVDDLALAIKRAGIPTGMPMDAKTCRLWPVGAAIAFEPTMSDFVESEPLENVGPFPAFCYTGGKRLANGKCEANSEMPLAVVALFDCPQALIQYDSIFPQGIVYSHHKCLRQLKRGERVRFKLSWDGKTTVQSIAIELKHGQSTQALNEIRSASKKSALDVLISFAGDVTVEEAANFANALSEIDSAHIKLNGRKSGDFFYRAFQPLVKWRDRKERLTQPFEIYLMSDNPSSPRVVYIEEDWSDSTELDPKLTEKQISIYEMAKFTKTDSCLFYAPKNMKLKYLQALLLRIPQTVINLYVYGE